MKKPTFALDVPFAVAINLKYWKDEPGDGSTTGRPDVVVQFSVADEIRVHVMPSVLPARTTEVGPTPRLAAAGKRKIKDDMTRALGILICHHSPA